MLLYFQSYMLTINLTQQHLSKCFQHQARQIFPKTDKVCQLSFVAIFAASLKLNFNILASVPHISDPTPSATLQSATVDRGIFRNIPVWSSAATRQNTIQIACAYNAVDVFQGNRFFRVINSYKSDANDMVTVADARRCQILRSRLRISDSIGQAGSSSDEEDHRHLEHISNHGILPLPPNSTGFSYSSPPAHVSPIHSEALNQQGMSTSFSRSQ